MNVLRSSRSVSPWPLLALLVSLGWAGLPGCADLGDDPISAPPTDAEAPRISAIVPVRTVVGDTVQVTGTGFGAAPGDLEIVFAAADGRVAAEVVSWSDTAVRVLVPATAVDGDLVVRRDREASASGLRFSVAPRLVSFASDLRAAGAPFQRQGCNSCHFSQNGGESGFSVASPADIRAGGQRGPGAIPRRADESLIIQAVRGLRSDLPRMPLGGNAVPEEEIQLIEDWINQGMRDN